MNQANSSNQVFIKKLTEIILDNLEKEDFGVNELADEAGMSSSALRRKLHTISEKSINQLIREVRLQKAMELLLQENFTASEVAYKVGFGSPTYFNKCFHDHFGYPPGEVKNKNIDEIKQKNKWTASFFADKIRIRRRNKTSVVIILCALILVVIIVSLKIFPIFNKAILAKNNALKAKKSIIVIPFKSLNNEEDNIHFAEGISENIQDKLIQIDKLKVLAVNPIFIRSENQLNIQSIASKFSVNYIVTGSVQRNNNKILVLVRLNDIKRNQLIWSEKYNEELSDIFSLQSDIAKQVAAQLETVITPKEQQEIDKVPTTNTEAYSYYLKGRYFLNRRIENSRQISRQYFEMTLKADPEFAEAYVGLADSYIAISNSRGYHEKQEAFNKAKKLTLKALELSPDLAYAHAILGAILYQYEWNWKAAEKELELAVQLNPNSVMSHLYFSSFLRVIGDFKKSRVHCNKALELNPTSWRVLSTSIELHLTDGKLENALEDCIKLEELFPDFYAVYWRYWHIYYFMGEYEKAVNSLEKALSYFSENDKFTNSIQSIYKQSGIKGVLHMQIEYLEQDEKDNPNPLAKARTYAWLGNKEKTIHFLTEATELLPYKIPNHFIRPEFKFLYNEPAFQSLLMKMKLAPYYKNIDKQKLSK